MTRVTSDRVCWACNTALHRVESASHRGRNASRNPFVFSTRLHILTIPVFNVEQIEGLPDLSFAKNMSDLEALLHQSISERGESG